MEYHTNKERAGRLAVRRSVDVMMPWIARLTVMRGMYMYLRVRRKINIKDTRILSFGTLYQFTENLNVFYVISDTC